VKIPGQFQAEINTMVHFWTFAPVWKGIISCEPLLGRAGVPIIARRKRHRRAASGLWGVIIQSALPAATSSFKWPGSPCPMGCPRRSSGWSTDCDQGQARR